MSMKLPIAIRDAAWGMAGQGTESAFIAAATAVANMVGHHVIMRWNVQGLQLLPRWWWQYSRNIADSHVHVLSMGQYLHQLQLKWWFLLLLLLLVGVLYQMCGTNSIINDSPCRSWRLYNMRCIWRVVGAASRRLLVICGYNQMVSHVIVVGRFCEGGKLGRRRRLDSLARAAVQRRLQCPVRLLLLLVQRVVMKRVVVLVRGGGGTKQRQRRRAVVHHFARGSLCWGRRRRRRHPRQQGRGALLQAK
jgi:hypothetical protein